MRNPLSAILQCTDDISSALEQIAKDPPDSTTITAIITDCIEAAETIALCAQHQKSIVDDILTISKLDSDLIQIIPTAVQPVDVVSRALKMFEAECRQKVIGIELNAADSFKELGIDWVVTDPSRLLQVLINLMTNAIKFTQSQAKRSIRVRLSVSLKPPSEGTHSFHYIPRKLPISVAEQEAGIGTAPEVVYLQFEVQDTGRGLTAAEMKLLFIRFSQASPRTHAEYGGSGLGLFISRQLTELLGGQIGVESEAGIGSTFAFYVRAERAEQKPGSKEAMEAIVEPMLRRETQVARSMSRRERVGPTHPIQPPLNSTTKRGKLNPKDLHVLIVEDNLVNQKVLSKQLNKLGCTVAVACHGGEALEYLETTEFWTGKEQTGNKLTIILMDLEMPVMDGLTAVQNIRDLEAKGTIRAKIPVIAVTANVRSEQIVAAKNSGMVRLLAYLFLGSFSLYLSLSSSGAFEGFCSTVSTLTENRTEWCQNLSE
jgi:CheY-like chemotaxis protein